MATPRTSISRQTGTRRSRRAGGGIMSRGWFKLLLGTLLVIIAGMLQQTQPVLAGPAIPWPNVALWAAAGWGLSGLAIRKVALLMVFGLVQDILLNAPLGAFVLVNLSALGVSAWLSGRNERDGTDARGLLHAMIAILAGYGVTVFLAMTINEASPRLLPVMGDLGVTILLFLLVFPVFNLPQDDQHIFKRR